MKRYYLHHKTEMSFLERLVEEIKRWYKFTMTDIFVLPQNDAVDFPQHRNDKLKILFEFYGKSKEDVTTFAILLF